MTTAPRDQLEPLLEFASQLADVASATIVPHFRKALAVENKAGGAQDRSKFDPVTIADRAAERAIRDLLSEHYPDHGIIGEEFGTFTGNSPFSWVIDPIDGTRSFIMGYPTWGILIGLLYEGRPVLGIMDQPFTGERFFTDGTASFCKIRDMPAQKLTVRPCRSLEQAILVTTDVAMFSPGYELQRFQAVSDAVSMTRYGGDCYAYCMLSSGLIDIIVESDLKPYDIVALIPIIERAGGVITTWDGGDAAAGGRIVAAGDAAIHKAALEIFAAG